MDAAIPAIGSCTGTPSLADYLTIEAIAQDIHQSTAVGFTVIMTTSKDTTDDTVANAGTYICQFTVGELSVQEEIIIQN